MVSNEVCAMERMVHSWNDQETSREEMESEPDIEENGQDFDRWRQGGAQQEENTKHQ